MILTNTETGEAWENVYYIFIAEKVGRHFNTIRSWHKSGRNHVMLGKWHIYFRPTEVKQDKGFAKKC